LDIGQRDLKIDVPAIKALKSREIVVNAPSDFMRYMGRNPAVDPPAQPILHDLLIHSLLHPTNPPLLQNRPSLEHAYMIIRRLGYITGWMVVVREQEGQLLGFFPCIS